VAEERRIRVTQTEIKIRAKDVYFILKKQKEVVKRRPSAKTAEKKKKKEGTGGEKNEAK
jgi:hypothetical protein